MQGVASLDTPISDVNSLTLVDTLQADFRLEDETIDKMYAEHSKSELCLFPFFQFEIWLHMIINPF